MLTDLNTPNKVVGVKQLKKALRDGSAKKVFVAQDADPKLTNPICESCQSAALRWVRLWLRCFGINLGPNRRLPGINIYHPGKEEKHAYF